MIVMGYLIQLSVMAIQIALPSIIAYDVYQDPANPRLWCLMVIAFLFWHYQLDGLSAWNPKNAKRFLDSWRLQTKK